MGVAVEIEVGEVRNRFLSAAGRHFTRPHEASEALNHLDVQEVRRMKLVLGAKEAPLDSCP